MKNKSLEQENQQQPPTNNTNHTVNYWLAFFFGVIISAVIITSILPNLANEIKTAINIVGWSAIILAMLFFFITIFKEGLFKFFFGFTKGELTEVRDTGVSLFQNLIVKDLKGAKADAGVLGKKGLGWYSWKNYRWWVINLFYVLFLGFASLFGSMLLYNQNQLLENQNKKIDAQIQLEESSRRGNLIVMMSNIMDKVDEELSEGWNDKGYKGRKLNISDNKERRDLSPQLVGRIAALSQSFKPYRFLKDTVMIKKSYSPDRGQLLLALANSALDTITYEQIYEKATFEKSYLDGVHMKTVNLSRANLRGSSLNNSELIEVYLKKSNLDSASLINADLRLSDLRSVRFINANLTGAILRGVKLDYAHLLGTNLTRADLTGADLNLACVLEENWLELLDEWEVIGKEEIKRDYFIGNYYTDPYSDLSYYHILKK